MKLSQLKDLTATIPVDYRGLQFDITIYTERVYDKDVRAEADARAGAEPQPPAASEPRPENVPDEEMQKWEERAVEWLAASAAYRRALRAWERRKGYEFLVGITQSWTINDEETDAPLPVSVEVLEQLGEILPAFITKTIMAEIARPLKPIN